MDRIINLCLNIFMAICAGIGAYAYFFPPGSGPTAAPGEVVAVATMTPWWAFVLMAIGFAGLITSWLRLWLMMRKRTRNPGNDAWTDGVKLEKIYNRTFTNESVALDGRHFVSPVFDNVTLFYQGTGPVFMENVKYILRNGRNGCRLATRNKVVGMALKIQDNLLKGNGLPATMLNLGPEATFDAPQMENRG